MNRLHSNGYVCILLPMELCHVVIIHAVEVVTSQDNRVGAVGTFNLKELFTYRVRRALIPILQYPGFAQPPISAPSPY